MPLGLFFVRNVTQKKDECTFLYTLIWFNVSYRMSDTNRTWRFTNTGAASTHLKERAQGLRTALRLLGPKLVAELSGVSYLEIGPDRGELHIPLWGNVCILPWPDLTGYNNSDDVLPDFQQALLLYYLVTANGASQTGKWISFADLPGGRIYNQAFQSYSGNELSKAIGLNLESFKGACKLAGGEFIDIGSASYIFQALPRVPLMVTYWLGDEEFPSSCKILLTNLPRIIYRLTFALFWEAL